MPRLAGPTHDGSHATARSGNRSQRHTARTRKGTKSASVPPLAKGPTKIPVNNRTGASHRSTGGTMTKISNPVASHAARSIQSVTM